MRAKLPFFKSPIMHRVGAFTFSLGSNPLSFFLSSISHGHKVLSTRIQITYICKHQHIITKLFSHHPKASPVSTKPEVICNQPKAHQAKPLAFFSQAYHLSYFLFQKKVTSLTWPKGSFSIPQKLPWMSTKPESPCNSLKPISKAIGIFIRNHHPSISPQGLRRTVFMAMAVWGTLQWPYREGESLKYIPANK